MLSEDKELVERVRVALNKEYVKRSLIRYFAEKSFDDFERPVYAPILQDLPLRIPELMNKVEVTPYVKELNPATGQVRIGWNLFVLGTNRMDLGYSSHNNMQEFQNAVNGPAMNTSASNQKTPKEITDFVLKVMGNSLNGMVQVVPDRGMVASPRVNGPMSSSMPGAFYGKNR